MRNIRVFPHAHRYAASWLFTLGLVFALAVLVSTGCTISPAYVKADRATFDAIAPEYRAYVHADPILSEAEEQRRERTLSAWEARLSEMEKP